MGSDITDAGPRLRAMNDALTGFDQMRAEIDRLRKREAELLAAGDRLESQLCEAALERDRLRLTDAEREAVAAAIGWIESPSAEDEAMPDDYLPITATLRGLLERMK